MRRDIAWIWIIVFLITGCVMYTPRVSEWTASNNVTIEQIITVAKKFAAVRGNEIKITDCRIGDCRKKVAFALIQIKNGVVKDNKKIGGTLNINVDATKEKMMVYTVAFYDFSKINEEDRRNIQEESANQFYTYLFQELNISDRNVVIK